jgi:hypothetical protein
VSGIKPLGVERRSTKIVKLAFGVELGKLANVLGFAVASIALHCRMSFCHWLATYTSADASASEATCSRSDSSG